MFSRVARDKAALFVGVSSAALLSFDPAMAQTAGFQTTDELVVYGTVVTRNGATLSRRSFRTIWSTFSALSRFPQVMR